MATLSKKEKIMKVNGKLTIILNIALLVIGGVVANGAPRTTAQQKNARRESKSRERSERGDVNKRGESGEAGESEQDQSALAREAKITMKQARATALNRAPGNVESSELEREHGLLVYSFDIRNTKGTITEVQVNALTGKIARIEHENKKQEAAEKGRERRERGGNPDQQ
jgi:uncharacterized membrane protein YkoI